VEIVRRAFEAIERGDRAAWLKEYDADVVVQQTPPIPDARTYHGHEGLVQVLSDWTQVFGDLVMTPEDFADAGNDKVLVRIHQQARGASSGVPIDFYTWFVFTVGGGKIARLEMFNHRDQALEAAGLQE
jgi:ketosteroid isomerase-like protein